MLPKTRSVPLSLAGKNWLFCKSDSGAVAAADVYSIVETAKANGLDVLKYLNYIFQRIPTGGDNLIDEFLETLMLWNETVWAECTRGYI